MNALLPPSARHLLRAAVTVLCLLPLAVRAASPAEEKLHAELRELRAVYEKAIATGDLSPLEPLFAPDSSGVAVDNQPFKNFAELKGIYDRFRAQFPGVVYRITLQPELSQLYGDIAVAHGTAEENVKTAAGEFPYPSRFTVVLRRTDQGWKLVRSQMTMDPFRNSVVQHFLSRTKLYFGLGALAAGALVGFIIGRVSARRPAAARDPATTAA